MFYNHWVLLWAPWLLFNGPHCGMHRRTLPAPCDVVCNGDSYIRSNTLWQHGHATMSVCCYWKKHRAERGHGCCVAPHQSTRQPRAGDCLNLALCLVLSYVQMADETLRDGFFLGRAFFLASGGFNFEAGSRFHVTSCKFLLNEQVKEKIRKRKKSEMCSALFHQNCVGSCSRWPSLDHMRSGFTCKAIRCRAHRYLVIENMLTCCWSCVTALNIHQRFPYASGLEGQRFFCVALTCLL